MRNLRKAAIASAALASVVLAIGCGSEKKTEPVPVERVRGVETITLQRAELPSYYEAVGTVRALRNAQVAAQVMGTLVRVNVREGDRVKTGQVLAVIDDSQTGAALDRASAGKLAAEQEIAAAEAEFSLAEATLKRYQSLFEKRSVSPHEMDEVKTRYEAAKARVHLARAGRAGAEAALAHARTSHGFSQVRAPFPGVITARLAETGSLAAPGAPIVEIEDTSAFRLEATVDERGIAAVRTGESVPVVVDALGNEPITGRVVQILPSADPASRTFTVKIELPRNTGVRSGLFGRARFPLHTREVLAVPRSAIVERGNMHAVYVLGADEIASLRYVTLGSVNDHDIEVLSGLDTGERIVAQPGAQELNGRKIEVR